ncbi:MAG: HpcH/HpaI aldolase/citrate lyase family protein [Burkholderiales bacterium]
MRLVRTALFAPGGKERVMAKALAAGAHAVILDLEDSVPVAAKAEARALVAKAIDGAAGLAVPRPTITVRTNGAATGLLADDLAAVVRRGLDAIFLPKVESVEQMMETASLLDREEAAHGLAPGAVRVIPMFESALGVLRCYELARATPRVAATCIGNARDGDLQTDLGCGWSAEGTELFYARSKVLLDSRAAGVYALDGVYSDLNDEAGFIRDCTLSARLGYIGRTVIHPKQIAPARRAYAVSEADAAYYRRVVSEFEAVEKSGASAAITVDGKLVDYAMYQRAKRVLEWARLDGN